MSSYGNCRTNFYSKKSCAFYVDNYEHIQINSKVSVTVLKRCYFLYLCIIWPKNAMEMYPVLNQITIFGRQELAHSVLICINFNISMDK